MTLENSSADSLHSDTSAITPETIGTLPGEQPEDRQGLRSEGSYLSTADSFLYISEHTSDGMKQTLRFTDQSAAQFHVREGVATPAELATVQSIVKHPNIGVRDMLGRLASNFRTKS